MSLVLEALRRVEKTDARTGSIGATVPSYRPVRKRTGSALPLILGLAAGGLVVVFFGPQARDTSDIAPFVSAARPAEAVPDRHPKGRAGLPPPLVPPADGDTPAPSRSKRLRSSAGEALGQPVLEPSAAPSLVLQAISERDSRPIAVINDKLVREGDWVGAARVIRIGPETVEVMLEGGRPEVVRFATPPEPSPSPTPL